MTTRSSFICEECYSVDPVTAVIRYPQDRFVLNAAIWSEDNQTLLARVPVKKLCKVHALMLKQNMKGDPDAGQELLAL